LLLIGPSRWVGAHLSSRHSSIRFGWPITRPGAVAQPCHAAQARVLRRAAHAACRIVCAEAS
jgi:hypothetical protein